MHYLCRYNFGKNSTLAFVFAVLTSFVWAVSNAAPESVPDIETAVARAEAWITANPATLHDGGINDIIDEGVLLYVRHNLTKDPEEREQYAAVLREHMARLEKMPSFRQFADEQHRRLIDVYHLVLAMHIARSVGQPFADESAIVERARQALKMTPYCGPTVRLTVATLLDYLGAEPVLDLKHLLQAGAIAQLAYSAKRRPLPGTDDPAASRVAAFYLYAIVHEVIVLTDFGRRSVSVWLDERRDIVVKELRAGVQWAMERAQYDLLAELLITLQMLEVPVDKKFRDAIVALAQAQQPDGTWGESATTTRENRVRHAVLTGAQALWIHAKATNQATP
ncbi:MAG: hypothetical protein EP297_12760 [Gammaproteobacteria bacterium]|nr:MAG: hypothetical protein EP297_12760 [Gammaproteobacteria bacterium]